jgi:hypothetical protein
VKYTIKFAADHTTVLFKGHIDERIGEAMTEIRPQVKTHGVVFDLSAVDLINSIGISTWIAHLAAFDGLDVRYLRCPHSFVTLCEMIPVLVKGRRLESFFIRYACDSCAGTDVHYGLVTRAETVAAGGFPAMACPRCKKPMEHDPHDDDFKSFFGV